MKTMEPVNDESKFYLRSKNADGNVTIKRILRPIVNLWKGKSTDNSELTTVSRHSDSQLTSWIKSSGLRYLFLVRVLWTSI
jgi:hypothetical protein